jgi:predicted component of type VI protein secretion system
MKDEAHPEGEVRDVGLRITVFNEVDQTTTDLLFNRFPVRVGRNRLNDLVLNHAYVSQWHAVIGFDTSKLSVAQVGSTNSVLVGDRKLQPNEEVALAGGETISIRPFALHVQAVSLPPSFRQPAQPAAAPSTFPAPPPEGVPPIRALEDTALRELDSLCQRFLGQTLNAPGDVALFVARIEEILDVFLRCFVALQKGQQQFQQAVDIRVLGRHDNPVEQAASSAHLAGALFSLVELDAPRQLENAFKNVMIHQVALLTGLMAGVRSLLEKLSPEAITTIAEEEHRVASVRALWQTYQRVHGDLAEEDAETFETIFGPQFAKAYSALTGEQPERSPRRKARKR